MSSEFVQLLLSWGLTESESRLFEDNGFNTDILRMSKIAELQPILVLLSLGSQVKFKRKFESFLLENPASEDESDIYKPGPSIRTTQAVTPSTTLSHFSQSSTSLSVADVLSVNLISQSPPAQDSSADDNETIVVIPESKEKRKESDSSSPGIRKSPRLQQKAHPIVAPETSKRNLFEEKSLGHTICNHKKLEETIKNESKGDAVLRSYAISKSLSNKERGIIANIIAAVELKESPNAEIKTSRLNELCRYVCRLFPTEDPSEWYSPHKTVNKIAVRAKGRLQNIRDNIRKGLIAAGTASSKRPSKAKQKQIVQQNATETAKELQDKVTHLKKAQKITAATKTYWRETADIRWNEWGDQPIHKIFEAYPILGLDEGWELFEIDFELKYPKQVHSLEVNWSNFKESLLTYTKEKCETDKNAVAVVKQNNINLNEGDDDLSTIEAAKLLALLLNRCINIGNWKLEKQDIIDGFMMVATSEVDITAKIDAKKSKFATIGRGSQMQVFPIALDYVSETKGSVYVNDKLYRVRSPLAALDLSFKITQVLGTEYPKEAKVAWMYLQKHLYNIKTEFDVTYAEERKLLKALFEHKLKLEQSQMKA